MRKPYQSIAATLLAAYAMPGHADIADCAGTLQRLDLAVARVPTKQPGGIKQALELRQEGEQLCLNGDTQGGLAKLQEALALFPSAALPPAPAQPQ